MQDFRGRYKSEGSFQCWWDAGADAADTIKWIKDQAWSTGVVFAQGASATAIAAYLEEEVMPDPRVLRAQYNIVGTAELHRTVFQGGGMHPLGVRLPAHTAATLLLLTAYRYSLMHGWLSAIGEQSFEHNFTSHEALTSYYDPVSMTGKWNRVTCPAVHLTGFGMPCCKSARCQHTLCLQVVRHLQRGAAACL